MRISDWSSDVCSSDLVVDLWPCYADVWVHDHAHEPRTSEVRRRRTPRVATLMGVADPRATGIPRLRRSSGLSAQCAPGDRAFGGGIRGPTSRPRHMGQIGRASCRERVCPYV